MDTIQVTEYFLVQMVSYGYITGYGVLFGTIGIPMDTLQVEEYIMVQPVSFVIQCRTDGILALLISFLRRGIISYVLCVI